MNYPQLLTKTNYLAFVTCSKSFWLVEYEPERASPLDPAVQRRLTAGQVVDQLAQERYENGRLIPYRIHPQAMAPLTQQAIDDGAEVLFQATFLADNMLVKVDVLEKTAVGWHLIEVKSSTKYKADEHLPDVAFQLYVLEKAGLPIAKVSLMHLDNSCRHPDLSNLFALTEVTDEARAYLPQVAIDAQKMRRVLAEPQTPKVKNGRFCNKPYECSFKAHCWQGINGLTIYDVPYLKAAKEQQLEANGVLYLHDIPVDFSLGHKTATEIVTRINQQQITINQETIQAQMAELAYPLYFFDFETIDYAVPLFEGCKPYQQVPFQYSCHILKADGTLTHKDFLHTSNDDPRRALAEALLADIGETGHIVAYNISFERMVIKQLAEALPEYAEALLARAERLWDQLPIFRQHYRHYAFGKSNSLKSVLPVLVPELSYAMLEVQNGTQAQVVWEQMIVEQNTAVKQQQIEHLLAYCHLDTLAMVEIHRVLQTMGE